MAGLDRIGAGFVERVYFFKIIFNASSRKGAEPDPGFFKENLFLRNLARGHLQNCDARVNPMPLSLERLQNKARLFPIPGFSDRFAFKVNEGVRPENRAVFDTAHTGFGLLDRMHLNDSGRGRLEPVILLIRRFKNAKSDARFFKEKPSARRA